MFGEDKRRSLLFLTQVTQPRVCLNRLFSILLTSYATHAVFVVGILVIFRSFSRFLLCFSSSPRLISLLQPN